MRAAAIDRDAQHWNGLVLCGGRGSRLGGADKGLLLPGGAMATSPGDMAHSAAAAAVALLSGFCDRVFLSANRNHALYRCLPAKVLPDLKPGYCGPLAGLEAVGREALATHLLLLPCDLPLLDAGVLRTLQDALLRQTEAGAVYAATAGREHFLCAAIRSACLVEAGAVLDEGEHAVRAFMGRIGAASVDITAPLDTGLKNFNSRKDWTALEKR